ncbi:mCG1030169, partial [Mus musculus]
MAKGCDLFCRCLIQSGVAWP